MLPAHPRTSAPRTRSYNEEEHGKPLRTILGVDRRCYRRPTACSPTCPHPPPSLYVVSSLLFYLTPIFFLSIYFPSLSLTLSCPPYLVFGIHRSRQARTASSSFPGNFSSYTLLSSFRRLSSRLCRSIYTQIYLHRHLADDPPIAGR